MSSSSSVYRSSSSSRYVEVPVANQAGDWGSLLTLFLLGAIILSGPLVLGAARLWFELPLLCAVALLLLLQGLRLATKPLPGAIRQVDAIDLSVVIFLLYSVGRWLTSPTEFFSRIEVMDILAYATVFFTCRYGLRDRKSGLVLLFGLVVLGVFETGFGYYLASHPDFFPFGPSEQLQIYYAPRWVGTYGCPNHYGALLVMAFGASLALGCFSKLSWPLRIVLFYLGGMMMVGILFSESRGTLLGWIMSIIALTIFGLKNGTVRWWIPVLGGLAAILSVGAVLASSSSLRERIETMTSLYQNGKLDGTYVRIELARDALHIAQDHPAFGTGPGTFVFVHPRYQSSTFGRKAVLTHDDYLNCLDDYGLIGFGLAMFFVTAVTLKFFQRLRSDNRWQDRVMVATGFAAWSALLIHSLVDFNLHIPANALLFFSLIGLGLGRLSRRDGGHWSTLSLIPLGRWLGWALVILSLGYGFLAGRTAMGDILYEQTFANALDVPTSDSIQSAEQALQYDPHNPQTLTLLGDLHRYDASRKEDVESRFDECQKALELYRRALVANSLDDIIQGKMGKTFDLMRRDSEAFLCYKAAVTAQPYNGEFWCWLGNHYWQRGMLLKAEQAYLMGTACPHGKEDNVEAESELRDLPEMDGVPLPEPGINPLDPSSTPGPEDHPPTVP